MKTFDPPSFIFLSLSRATMDSARVHMLAFSSRSSTSKARKGGELRGDPSFVFGCVRFPPARKSHPINWEKRLMDDDRAVSAVQYCACVLPLASPGKRKRHQQPPCAALARLSASAPAKRVMHSNAPSEIPSSRARQRGASYIFR